MEEGTPKRKHLSGPGISHDMNEKGAKTFRYVAKFLARRM